MKLLYIALIAMVAMTTVTVSANFGEQSIQSRLAQLQDLKSQANQQLYQQYAMEQQLQAAAAAAALNPRAISDSVNGLTQAVQFWGTFIGNNVFDVQFVQDRINDVTDKRDHLVKYTSWNGNKALVQMNQAIWGINTAVKSIESMAKLLKNGATNS